MEPKRTGRLNYNILFLLVILFFISCAAIYYAQQTKQYPSNFVIRQVFWYFVGFLIIIGAMSPDEEQLNKIAWFFYGLNIAVLLFLFAAPDSIAPERNNAKSWFVLPGIGSVQPSEFMKVSLVLVISRIISKHNAKYENRSIGSDFRLIAKLTLAALLPIILILLQPDLGTSLVIMFLLFVMIFISGISWKIILPIYTFAASAASLIIYMVLYHSSVLEKYLKIQSYQFERIYVWFNPESYADNQAFNYLQTIKAIGSGETFGRKFDPGDLVYVPEKHSDFIFSVIGENYGFLGTSLLITVYLLLIYNIIVVGLKANDSFTSYTCVGIVAVLVFHIVENIGMCTGILPITGIPLPFISYGGSSLMSNMLAIGIVLNISNRTRSYMFN